MYLALLLLLAFSAFFSASETALSSVNRIRMKNKADDGDKKAQRVLGLSDEYDRTLSAILIGNNVVNLTASSISTVIATSLLGQQGAAVATAVITVLVLVFGEILPKSFAKDHAERVSMAMGGPLYIVKTLLAPLVWVFVQIKRLFTGRRSSELNVQPSVTEEELKTIIDTVGEEGVLDRQETDIIQSAIEFDNTTVQDILVPRVDMAAAALDAPPEEIIRLCVEGGYSRIPVYEGTIDNVVGVLYAKDLLARLAAGKPIEPAALKRDVLFVYRSKRISELLAEFRRAKQHMAVVTDLGRDGQGRNAHPAAEREQLAGGGRRERGGLFRRHRLRGQNVRLRLQLCGRLGAGRAGAYSQRRGKLWLQAASCDHPFSEGPAHREPAGDARRARRRGRSAGIAPGS